MTFFIAGFSSVKPADEISLSSGSCPVFTILGLKGVVFFVFEQERERMCARTYITCACDSQDNFWELVLSFHPVDLGVELKFSGLPASVLIH